MNLTAFAQEQGIFPAREAVGSKSYPIPPAGGNKVASPATTPALIVQTGKGTIPQGSRNNTLSRKAGQLLKKHGDSEKAYNAFMSWAGKCEPPLDDVELSTIWVSAKGFFHSTIKNAPNYIPPDEYATQDFINPWVLPIVDDRAMSALCAGDPKTRKFGIAVARLFLRAFGVTIRLNDMNRRAEIHGLPTAYSGEDAVNLLPTLIADVASALAYKRATNNIIHDVLAVLASENRFHPVIELLNAEPWDNQDRKPEIYRMLGITADFYKTLIHKWSLQSIAVLYNTEDKAVATQGVLTLQSTQGKGKTEFIRHLAICPQFFKGGATLDTSNKDTLLSATKVWICELGELDATTKKEQSALKAFLTEQKDSFREPYARSETIRPRRTSFCGTVNPKGFLRDETGNRRYWVIPIETIDINAVFQHSPEWYAQFWRQIHEEYKQNPKGYLLTKEEQDRVNSNNTEFEAQIYGEDEFLTAFNLDADHKHWTWQTASQIADTMNDIYKGLNIRSEGIGLRVLPRVERRTGILFERKIVRGRRLILCPPRAVFQHSHDNDGSRTELLDSDFAKPLSHQWDSMETLHHEKGQ